jgi:hypothetical protein
VTLDRQHGLSDQNDVVLIQPAEFLTQAHRRGYGDARGDPQHLTLTIRARQSTNAISVPQAST